MYTPSHFPRQTSANSFFSQNTKLSFGLGRGGKAFNYTLWLLDLPLQRHRYRKAILNRSDEASAIKVGQFAQFIIFEAIGCSKDERSFFFLYGPPCYHH
jgi:hypothetical protein